jgi:hypothetical protein
LANNFSGRLLLWGRIIGRHVAQNRKQTSLPRWVLCEEEADESLYWMELLIESSLVPQARLAELTAEGNEFVAIAVASIRTARARKQ